MDCVLTKNEPCCLPKPHLHPSSKWNELWWDLPYDEKKEKSSVVECPDQSFGIEHDGENACFFQKRDVICPGSLINYFL